MGIAEPETVLAAIAERRPNREVQILRMAMRVLASHGFTKASVDCARLIAEIRQS